MVKSGRLCLRPPDPSMVPLESWDAQLSSCGISLRCCTVLVQSFKELFTVVVTKHVWPYFQSRFPKTSSGRVSSCAQPSLFAYWLWSCIVTVLILLTKYCRPCDDTLLNYFLQPRGITSACWTCSTDGRSISLAATIRPPLYTPSLPSSLLSFKSNW